MKRTFMVLFAVMFLVMLGVGIIIPVMPGYVQSLGASSFELGWLMATYSIMNFLLAPFWGGLSDRIGRKPVLLIGLIGMSLAYVLFGLSTQLWMLFGARILAGMLSAAAMPTVMAYVADITTPENRGKGMGMVGAAVGLGFVFGPAIGGLLSRWGVSTPFFFASAVAFITFLFALGVLKETLTDEQRNKQKAREKRWAAFKGLAGYIYIMTFVVAVSMAGLESTFAFVSFDQLGLSLTQLGWIFTVMGVVGVIVQGGLVGRLIKRLGEVRVVQIGLLVSAVGFALITQVNSLLTAMIFLSIFGAGNGLIRPSVSALLSKNVGTRQGGAMGLLSSMDSLGRIVGPPVGGYLYLVGWKWPYVVGVVLSLAAFLIFLRYQQIVRVSKINSLS